MNTRLSIHDQKSGETDLRRIYTVSELTADIKVLLEDKYPLIWICGEISNFKIPASGHFYFTLKDENAQINAVMFRTQNWNLKFDLENGMSIIGLGRISVYEPRGTYQTIFEYLEPKGTGSIQLAFEQLKERLAKEGLFKKEYKTPLPFLPQKISIITSPSGSVVHDILKIIDRRFSNIRIEIIPVKVQGEGAEDEIVSAIELLNVRADSDLALLARGGGSLEDLHAFNSEDVARAIFASKIPIVSAVGHETDFTIADFVADLRAPTPSAAAELAVPRKQDFEQRLAELSINLTRRFLQYIEHQQMHLMETTKRLVHPTRKIEDLRMKTDDLLFRLIRTIKSNIFQQHERLLWRTEKLNANNPLIRTYLLKGQLEQIYLNLNRFIDILLGNKRALLREVTTGLHALSPKATLSRGYSITQTIPEEIVVRDPRQVSIGQDLKVTVAEGSIVCSVKGK